MALMEGQRERSERLREESSGLESQRRTRSRGSGRSSRGPGSALSTRWSRRGAPSAHSAQRFTVVFVSDPRWVPQRATPAHLSTAGKISERNARSHPGPVLENENLTIHEEVTREARGLCWVRPFHKQLIQCLTYLLPTHSFLSNMCFIVGGITGIFHFSDSVFMLTSFCSSPLFPLDP